jgi:ABC-2 type transport system ATP-binding protein
MENFETRFVELTPKPENLAAARALKPLRERQAPLGGNVLLFDNVERERLANLGETRTPSIADVFVAMMSEQGARA